MINEIDTSYKTNQSCGYEKNKNMTRTYGSESVINTLSTVSFFRFVDVKVRVADASCRAHLSNSFSACVIRFEL